MRMPTIASCLVGALLLGGCNASTAPPTDTMLSGAHASLAENDAVSARQWLASAKPTIDNARERKEYELLLAEVEIRTGQADLALPAMNQLLAADPSDPRAHEMAGKAQLMLGDFAEAHQHFNVAVTAYTRNLDVNRAEDLRALAKGFEAYAHELYQRSKWGPTASPAWRHRGHNRRPSTVRGSWGRPCGHGNIR